MPEALFSEAFALWGSPITWVELVAVVISVAMVGCNIREIHWGWPLAVIASGLYAALFWRSRLYGSASLQVFFIVMALWGWWQWLRGARADGSALRVERLPVRGRAWAIGASLAAWPAMALFLDRFTDAQVPWLDALPTALSLVSQVLLARKYLENWVGWFVVNLASVILFVNQGLWLTAALYLVFLVLSVAGWRAWRAQVAAA